MTALVKRLLLMLQRPRPLLFHDSWKDGIMIGYLINDAPQTQHNIEKPFGRLRKTGFFAGVPLDQGNCKKYGLQAVQLR